MRPWLAYIIPLAFVRWYAARNCQRHLIVIEGGIRTTVVIPFAGVMIQVADGNGESGDAV